jgi:hypothetical protein
VAKKDGPSKRLAERIAMRKRWPKLPSPVPEFLRVPDCLRDLTEFDSVRDAFKAFEYDPSNLWHWEDLIEALCEAHFGKRSGRPEDWDEDRLCRLAADFAKVQAKAQAVNPRKKGDEAVCKLLVTDKAFRHRYGKMKGGTIRRLLPTARKNLAECLATFKVTRGKSIVWTPGREKQLSDWLIDTFSADVWHRHPDIDRYVDDFVKRLRS